MEKLITLLETIGSVDTTNYPNIKWKGVASSDKINLLLLSDINAAASSAGITVTIGTANTGHRETTSSGNVSRHKTGEAVDISMINGVGWSSKSDAESKKILKSIESFVTNLRNAGYTVNSESGNPKSVLYFGFPEHSNHIHVSSKDGSSTSTSTIEKPTSTSAEEYATDYLVKALSKVINPMLGINESKQNRILKDIQKIKNLL